MRRKTTEQFILESKAIYGEGAFDYSKVEYKNSTTPVELTCNCGHVIHSLPLNHLRGYGCHICAHEKQKHLVYGIGVNDMTNTRDSLATLRWRGMLERCYCPKTQSKHPTYDQCTVCDEWLYLSNFTRWFHNPDNGYRMGYSLDKDILVKGNKVYGPNTCCFVPQEINGLIKGYLKRDLPPGVHLKNGRYSSVIRRLHKLSHLGIYDTPEAAFLVYKEAKEQYVKELAEKYYKEGKITERVYNALLNYRVEITD